MPNATEKLRPGRLATAVVVLSSLLLFVPAADASSSARPIGKTSALPTVTPASTRGPIRDLPAVPSHPVAKHELEGPKPTKTAGAHATPAGSAPPTGSMPAPSESFAGLHFSGNCGGTQCGAGYPPDTVGDVGPNNYVEAVNTSIGVYDKTGTQQAALTFNSLWQGSGTPCAGNNQGDPTVVYDPIGDRWIIADFGFASFTSPPYYECIAVSKTADPTGAYWLYAIRGDDVSHPWFPDYPKMNVWPDGVYYTANMFDTSSGETYEGVRTYALERSTLEAGGSVTPVIHDLSSTYYSLLPVNLRGTVPPNGTPAYFVSSDQVNYFFDVFKWTVDFVTPSNSTFTGPTQVNQATYTVPGGNVVPQPPPGDNNKLDSLGDRLMMQAQYRNIAGVESIWAVHTVGPNPLRLQWAQFNVTGGTVHTNPVQQQIYNPGGGLYRWMPSLAVDQSGNMAVGFSTSSSTVKPALHYAGRLATDPLNQLSQGERLLYQGTGVQSNNCGGPCHRWGDYSAMTVDPTDDCTFWYIGEVYDTNGGDWQTHIGSFSYPTCGIVPVKAVDLSDSGFNPTTLTAAQGSTVEWTNSGPSTNGVSDGTTLNLFDSDPLAVSDTYDFQYIGAGQYAVASDLSASMTVSVPLKILPKSGHTGTSFVVTWSSATAPAGASFTVQYQRPRTNKWRAFQVGVTGTHAKFKPDAGTGAYHFRAKMVNASGSSAFSLEKKVKVS